MADPVFKKDKVSQIFNLREMFGVDVSNAPEIGEIVGEAILEKIRTRTANGAGFGGAPFFNGKYSDAYAESIEFIAAGKDQHEVNMELSGDMMGLMDIVARTPNTIEIGWDDPTQNAKAFNHNTGDTVPKRNFFGLSKAEIREVVEEFRDEVQDYVRSQRTEGSDDYTERALSFLRELGDGEE